MIPYIARLQRFTVNIWSVLRLAWHEDWRLVTSRGLLKGVSAGIPAVQAYIGKLFFDTLSVGYGSGDRRVWRAALGYLLLEVLLLAGRTVLQSAGRLVDAQLNHLLRYGITRRIMAHAAVLDIASYEDKHLQERMQRLSDETPWRVQEIRRQQLFAIKTLLPDVGYACGLGLLACGVVRGAVTVGDAVMFIGAFKTAQGSLGTIAEAIGNLYERYLFITDLQAFLQLSPRLIAPAGARVLRPQEPLTVEFQQVWFRYAEDQPYSLRDVSLTLRAGQRVALIGKNGAGKTTLIKLLLRFYDPSAGRILINGTDLHEIDLASYYANIGMIFQDPMRHEARVREQIGYGDLAALHDLARIREAAKLGGADGFIDKLPGGFEAHLGLWALEEHTQKLSGGQWQRLALARAMMPRASLIILDEPTSSLDPRGEQRFFGHLLYGLDGRSARPIRFCSWKTASSVRPAATRNS